MAFQATSHFVAAESRMPNPFEDEDGEYIVLINEEGQHSLWPAYLDIPVGWNETGPRGKRSVCLAWIDEHWTDMRPRSLVLQMEADARARRNDRETEPAPGRNS